jgi:predicted TIM-barrel fold metal-dependent hydrolase
MSSASLPRLRDLVAIDVHVHLATTAWLVDSMGPYQTSVERYFGARLEPKSLEAMADEYRQARVHGILLAWDAETFTHRPPLRNEVVAEIAARFPDCFTGFGSVDPNRPDAVRRLREVKALGLKGLKLHPTLQGFDPAEDRFEPYFATAAELGLPLIVHSGTSGVGARQPGGQGLILDYCRPIKLDRWAAAYPGLKILLAHVGWPWHLEALAMALHKTNVYIDISGWKYKYLPPEVLREMRTRLVEQFCFGTDYPMFDLKAQLEGFHDLDLPAAVAERVLKTNAATLLGWEEALPA